MSQEHTLTIKHGTLSPGPAYYTQPPSVGGKQPDGRKPDPPVWRIGKAERFLFGYGKSEDRPGPDAYRVSPYILRNAATFGAASRDVANKVFVSQEHTLTIRAGSQSPGPMYMLPKSVGGKHPSGRVSNAPSYHLSGRARAPVDPGLDTPGAKYRIPQAHGVQPDGRHRSEPSWTIATKARTPVEPGLDTPGAKYNLPSACGGQPSARKRSAPVPTFSRYSRWADLEREQRLNTVPGPGYYG